MSDETVTVELPLNYLKALKDIANDLRSARTVMSLQLTIQKAMRVERSLLNGAMALESIVDIATKYPILEGGDNHDKGAVSSGKN